MVRVLVKFMVHSQAQVVVEAGCAEDALEKVKGMSPVEALGCSEILSEEIVETEATVL